MIYKFLIGLFLILFLINPIYSVCYIEFSSSNTPTYLSSVVYTDSLYENFYNNYPHLLSFTPYTSTYVLDETINYKVFYFYFLNSRLITRTNGLGCAGWEGVIPVTLPDFSGYYERDLDPPIAGTECVAKPISGNLYPISDIFQGDQISYTLDVSSNLRPITLNDGVTQPYVPISLLEDYYFMNVRYNLEVKNLADNIIYFYNIDNLNSNNFGTYDSVIFNIDTSLFPLGEYELSVKLDTLVEPKCTGRMTANIYTTTFTISPSPFGELGNIKINYISNTLTQNDAYTKNKIEFDYVNNLSYYINKSGHKELITLPTTEIDKKIIVYKNGVNIKNDTIKPEYIALNAHQIKLTKNKNELTDFVDKSYTLMKKLNITKKLDTSIPGKTRIKIKVDIPEGDRKNITIYQTIPKSQAASINNITTINNATAQFFVIDKDPIIGWYFNESSGSEEIEYELPGSSEGGVIIIMQEAILFNQGSLIINYREGSCESDEAHLFDFDDLSASQVYGPNNGGLYKVCVAHITEKLYNTPKANTLNISSHDGNLMNLSSTLSNLVQMSTTNPDIYWNMKIQETNPSTKHSCIGSLNDTNNPSLFGDCGYKKENRIWVYLGEDNEPPETTIYYPYLAHTMKISLIANDELSGVDKSYYCIKNETNPCTNKPADFTEYQGEFLITCPNKWGCIKEIFVYSTDKVGNNETPKRNILSILDEGSSCQADCTAKPSPNRYLSSCRNLNGCEYYNYNNLEIFDEGKYVAEQCNYLIENSWTYFNSTHEIKCPSGPFRKSRFTFEKLFFTSHNCDELIVIDYPVLLDGEQVIMKFIYCKDFN